MDFPDRTITPRPNTAIPADQSQRHLPARPLSFSGHFNDPQPAYAASVYSRADTPLPGIDQQTVREIRKRFDSAAKIADVVSKAIDAYMGGNAGVDDARVAQIIKKIMEDQGPRNRTFSTLQSYDLPHLYSGGVVGSIVYNPTQFPISPPDWFHYQLDMLIDTATRDKEANVRLLIGHYLSHAVSLARVHLQLPRLTFHAELDVDGEIVPEVGLLSGTLDFVCATLRGEGGLGELMSGADGGVDFIVDTPYLVILEAKKTDTLPLNSSKAELLGQVRVLLQKFTTRGRTGILTDGFTWKLFHLDSGFCMFSTVLRTDTIERRVEMLGILALLAGGRFPALPSDPEYFSALHLYKWI